MQISPAVENMADNKTNKDPSIVIGQFFSINVIRHYLSSMSSIKILGQQKKMCLSRLLLPIHPTKKFTLQKILLQILNVFLLCVLRAIVILLWFMRNKDS